MKRVGQSKCSVESPNRAETLQLRESGVAGVAAYTDGYSRKMELEHRSGAQSGDTAWR